MSGLFTPGRGDFEEQEWIDIRLKERKQLKELIKFNLNQLRYDFWWEVKLTFRKRR